ncbi:MAG: hypothetical protein QG583_459 [Patescibacteria group bacterium]|nr:hypothetical protein [Patescibacteria group bacterium]
MKDIAFLYSVVELFHDLLQDAGFSEEELEKIYNNWKKVAPNLENILRSNDIDEGTPVMVAGLEDVPNPNDPLNEKDLLIPYPTVEKVKKIDLDAEMTRFN